MNFFLNQQSRTFSYETFPQPGKGMHQEISDHTQSMFPKARWREEAKGGGREEKNGSE
jgi:hypothetical protein